MKKVTWVTLIVALILGGIGVYQRLSLGHGVAAYSSSIPWGLWVSVYIFFIGLSAGAFLFSTLVYVFQIKEIEPLGRLSLLTALATLIAALITIWLDLGHMERFWRVFVSPNFRSAMAWMVWLYTAYFLLLLLELWGALRTDGVGNTLMLKILGVIGIPLAIAFHGGVGTLFAVVEAKPYWNTPLFPLLFLVSALSSGSAFLTLVTCLLWPDKSSEEFKAAIKFLSKAVVGLLALDLLFELAEVMVGTYSTSPEHFLPYKFILAGQNWWIFWVVHLLFGALIPIVLLTLPKASVNSITWATFLISLGFLAVRYNIVIPGLIVPPLPGLPSAYMEARLQYSYTPTLNEWLVTLFTLALASAILLLGQQYLPITRPLISSRKESTPGSFSS
ncbi:prokaryotic molybdopterin-containing oxidoreductase family, membrane subunit [Thermanaeromonas toyohensis ToBE]|uniref:Prokaryotic molybdopterin-containing oxidoreductase family, membrane subunit n=1 Tax=Thermanaeromonas toyohensis ToBE TaxID=698762 RepID=A0A1W1W119_9FIRM|nr:NrfD/PsrC family molybdoenzyme membrane anchor subunit [Thermanaeromonas toyohensis]SMB99317.1 prokaryotic molybdopterin-containing oxidoreductase family, membrane subunit [Thermanaeromonas toyohensis ToBE]